MNNQKWKIRPEIVNINSDEPIFFLIVLKQVCAKLCVPDVVKDVNLKVFNLMSRTNETRHIKFHETCKCKCRLNANVCN